MNETVNPEQLGVQGSHIVNLSREKLWDSLNDPELLRKSIKGCEEVRKLNESTFEAEFLFRIGPVKKSFTAQMLVNDANPPKHYQLASDLSGGIAGSAKGTATVDIREITANCSELNYTASIEIHGALARFGTKLLGNTVHKYMNRFFDALISNLKAGQD